MSLHQDSERGARLRPALALAVLAVLCACSAASAGGDFPDVRERHRAAARVVEVAVSEESAQFSFIHSMDVDSRGRVYVCDFFAPSITILGPDGRKIGSLGRKGAGPGEFRVATAVQVLRGDSVLMYDDGLARVSIFPPDSAAPAHMTNLAPGLNGRPPWYLRRSADGSAYVAAFRPIYRFGYGDDFGSRRDTVRVLLPDGRRRADVVSNPSAASLVVDNSIAPNPFSRLTLTRTDSRGRVLVLWTDSLKVDAYDLDGRPVGGFRVEAPAQPVTTSDLEWAISEMGSEAANVFEQALKDAAPAGWPAASNLLLDDRDDVWIAGAGRGDREVEWMRFSPDGSYLGSVLLPPATRLYVVRNGLLYAVRQQEDGVPRVVVFRPDPALS